MSAKLGYRVTLTYRQLLVAMNPARTMTQPILFGGGKGGGKSMFLCAHAIRLGDLVPGNRCFLGRDTYSSFMGSTYQELETQILAHPDWKLWEGKHEAHNLRNGSEIWWGGLRESAAALKSGRGGKFGSTAFGFIGIVEAPETDRKVCKELFQRLRHAPAAEFRNEAGETLDMRQILLTGNPYPSWVKDDFITNPQLGYVFIRSLMRDNPYLPPGYEEEMRTVLDEDEILAFIEGDWDALSASEQALPETLLIAAVQRVETPDYGDVVWGIDVSRKGKDWTEVWERAGLVWRRVAHWQQIPGEYNRLEQSADKVEALYASASHRPTRINVDDSGVGGGLSDALIRRVHERKFGRGVVIGEVLGGAAAKDAVHYVNKNAELLYTFKAILENDRGQIPNDPGLRSELGAFWGGWVGARRKVDGNEIIRGRLGHSPDAANGLLLTLDEGGFQSYVPRGERAAGPDADLDDLDEDARQVELRRREALRQRERTVATFLQAHGLPGMGGRDDGDVGY